MVAPESSNISHLTPLISPLIINPTSPFGLNFSILRITFGLSSVVEFNTVIGAAIASWSVWPERFSPWNVVACDSPHFRHLTRPFLKHAIALWPVLKQIEHSFNVWIIRLFSSIDKSVSHSDDQCPLLQNEHFWIRAVSLGSVREVEGDISIAATVAFDEGLLLAILDLRSSVTVSSAIVFVLIANLINTSILSAIDSSVKL